MPGNMKILDTTNASPYSRGSVPLHWDKNPTIEVPNLSDGVPDSDIGVNNPDTGVPDLLYQGKKPQRWGSGPQDWGK